MSTWVRARDVSEMKLDSCPFCGSDDCLLLSLENHLLFRASCNDCSADGPPKSRPESAAVFWNKRRRTDDVTVVQ